MSSIAVINLDYARLNGSPARSAPSDRVIVAWLKLIVSGVVLLPCLVGTVFILLLLTGAAPSSLFRWVPSLG